MRGRISGFRENGSRLSWGGIRADLELSWNSVGRDSSFRGEDSLERIRLGGFGLSRGGIGCACGGIWAFVLIYLGFLEDSGFRAFVGKDPELSLGRSSAFAARLSQGGF